MAESRGNMTFGEIWEALNSRLVSLRAKPNLNEDAG